ncbi:TolC family protein [Ferruginibacter lapsinanis]|uniref:TolC family protein n=1 Tax=Ferruginibacter lapsinanis TaxID=563172 RepID=UPI001E5927A9|nr:TolC family protein [Ferruginibacter lapsinanis]UEG49728.1 TolC family protein [Ferruginibacter lapsinanis]
MLNLSKIYTCIAVICLVQIGCKVPAIVENKAKPTVPLSYGNSTDTANSAAIQWRTFFADKDLETLIDTALKNNKELLITLQEIEIARNDIRVKKGQLLPSVIGGGGIGVEKVGRYTSQGAGDASTEIKPGTEVPDWLPDYKVGAYATWEIDIWKKLRTEKKAAVTRYLSTVEGKNFLITNLIAEIANDYYELLALDNQLEIVKQTITLQQNALEVVKVQKDAGRETSLAVKKFEAEVLNSQSREFDIQQKIKETENEINFLLGRYPQPVVRNTTAFFNAVPQQVQTGIPSQLLQQRPDIKQAELDLAAAKLDVKVARAEFYPSFGISSSIGFNAFKPSYLVKFPESLLASLAGDVAGPLINKNAIKAEFDNANARQTQALYNYEKTILNACIEVSTELSNLSNLEKTYQLKSKEVNALTASIDISNDLFKSARANYFEVLMTQRDAVESKLELIETKLHQFNAVTNLYRSLGGGWQ